MAVDRSRLARDNRQICIQMERMANYYLAASDVTGVQAQMLLYTAIWRQVMRSALLRPSWPTPTASSAACPTGMIPCSPVTAPT